MSRILGMSFVAAFAVQSADAWEVVGEVTTRPGRGHQLSLEDGTEHPRHFLWDLFDRSQKHHGSALRRMNHDRPVLLTGPDGVLYCVTHLMMGILYDIDHPDVSISSIRSTGELPLGLKSVSSDKIQSWRWGDDSGSVPMDPQNPKWTSFEIRESSELMSPDHEITSVRKKHELSTLVFPLKEKRLSMGSIKPIKRASPLRRRRRSHGGVGLNAGDRWQDARFPNPFDLGSLICRVNDGSAVDIPLQATRANVVVYLQKWDERIESLFPPRAESLNFLQGALTPGSSSLDEPEGSEAARRQTSPSATPMGSTPTVIYPTGESLHGSGVAKKRTTGVRAASHSSQDQDEAAWVPGEVFFAQADEQDQASAPKATPTATTTTVTATAPQPSMGTYPTQPTPMKGWQMVKRLGEQREEDGFVVVASSLEASPEHDGSVGSPPAQTSQPKDRPTSPAIDRSKLQVTRLLLRLFSSEYYSDPASPKYVKDTGDRESQRIGDITLMFNKLFGGVSNAEAIGFIVNALSPSTTSGPRRLVFTAPESLDVMHLPSNIYDSAAHIASAGRTRIEEEAVILSIAYNISTSLATAILVDFHMSEHGYFFKHIIRELLSELKQEGHVAVDPEQNFVAFLMNTFEITAEHATSYIRSQWSTLSADIKEDETDPEFVGIPGGSALGFLRSQLGLTAQVQSEKIKKDDQRIAEVHSVTLADSRMDLLTGEPMGQRASSAMELVASDLDGFSVKLLPHSILARKAEEFLEPTVLSLIQLLDPHRSQSSHDKRTSVIDSIEQAFEMDRAEAEETVNRLWDEYMRGDGVSFPASSTPPHFDASQYETMQALARNLLDIPVLDSLEDSTNWLYSQEVKPAFVSVVLSRALNIPWMQGLRIANNVLPDCKIDILQNYIHELIHMAMGYGLSPEISTTNKAFNAIIDSITHTFGINKVLAQQLYMKHVQTVPKTGRGAVIVIDDDAWSMPVFNKHLQTLARDLVNLNRTLGAISGHGITIPIPSISLQIITNCKEFDAEEILSQLQMVE